METPVDNFFTYAHARQGVDHWLVFFEKNFRLWKVLSSILLFHICSRGRERRVHLSDIECTSSESRILPQSYKNTILLLNKYIPKLQQDNAQSLNCFWKVSKVLGQRKLQPLKYVTASSTKPLQASSKVCKDTYIVSEKQFSLKQFSL